ncbi:unnamed protein product [Symbiodinium natans]|uniref:Uncharacterized protein n=1 Tax=Symbiodinium natans TaxID=878477 RepID=A0A812LTE0_9DINO|nr:unnamed protein product [Symbiodinium natans]
MPAQLLMWSNQTVEQVKSSWVLPADAIQAQVPTPTPPTSLSPTASEAGSSQRPSPGPPLQLDALLAALKWKPSANFAENLTTSHWRPHRYGAAQWSKIDAAIDSSGHTRCGTARDSWSCAGTGYSRELNHTKPWNASYDILKLPLGTQILALGNSLMAQLVHTVICSHHWDIVYPNPDIRANSVIVQNNATGIILVLISNEQDVDGSVKPSHPANLIRQVKWVPDIILLGSINHRNASWAAERRNLLREASPDATIIDLPEKHTGDCCAAPSCWKAKGCQDKFIPAHDCVPGPILRYAEQLVQVFQSAVHKEDFTQSCLGVGRERPLYPCL